MWKVRRSRGYGREITGIAVRSRSPAGAVFGCFGEWCSATGGDFCCQRIGAGSEDAQRDGSAQGRLRLVRVQMCHREWDCAGSAQGGSREETRRRCRGISRTCRSTPLQWGQGRGAVRLRVSWSGLSSSVVPGGWPASVWWSCSATPEDYIAGPVVAWDGGPPGSKSGACTGSPRNLGYLVFSIGMRRRGRRDRNGPGPRGIVPPRGERRGRGGGRAERRKRSEARREARSRSRLIGTDEVGELAPKDPADGKRPTG